MGIEGSANKVGIGKFFLRFRNHRCRGQYRIKPQEDLYNPARDWILTQINSRSSFIKYSADNFEGAQISKP